MSTILWIIVIIASTVASFAYQVRHLDCMDPDLYKISLVSLEMACRTDRYQVTQNLCILKNALYVTCYTCKRETSEIRLQYLLPVDQTQYIQFPKPNWILLISNFPRDSAQTKGDLHKFDLISVFLPTWRILPLSRLWLQARNKMAHRNYESGLHVQGRRFQTLANMLYN